MEIETNRPLGCNLKSKTLKILIRKKHRIWKKYLRTKNENDLDKFRQIRNEVVRNIKLAKFHYFNKLESIPISNKNQKNFWHICGKFLGNNNSHEIPPPEN